MSVGDPVIVQVAVEVQFGGGGSLYYDQSGRTQRNLLDRLGSPPFTIGSGSSPVVATGIVSSTERLSVEFSDQHLLVRQLAAETIVRVEQVAPTAWGEIHDRFELTRRVKRCGVRFWLMWAAASEDEAEQRILKAGLFAETPRCQEVFGAVPRKRAFVAVVGSEDEQVRYQLSGGKASISVEGAPATDIPDSFKKFEIPAGMLLDVDSGRKPYGGNVTRSDLKNFIRDSWRQAHSVAKALGALL